MSPNKQTLKRDWKKQRIAERYEIFDKKFYIFCEGKKTEPLYFNGIKKRIEKNPIYKNNILIEVDGVGAETLRVLEHAENYVKNNGVSNAEVWIIYDKDSFPDERFNGVQIRVDQLNLEQSEVEYFVGWSNQCIEYWFILHFDYYDSNNDRKYYRSYLDRKFHENGLGKYKKNNPQIFEILKEKGNPDLAVRHAQKRLENCEGLTPSQKAPATTVHYLYNKLKRYMQ